MVKVSHKKVVGVNPSFLGKIKEWFFPYTCCLCGGKAEITDLCATCFALFPWVTDRCFRCGLRLKAEEAHCCERCQKTPLPFDRLFALFQYDPPVRQLITGLKFEKNLSYGRILGEILAKMVPQWYAEQDLPEAIIPMPLHLKRLRNRGFNQSAELLMPLRKALQLPILFNTCERVKKTKPQSGLNAEQRRLNVGKAFKLKKPLPLQHVAIMDDVVTTGSTVAALARLLKESGIQQVDIWCICRV